MEDCNFLHLFNLLIVILEELVQVGPGYQAFGLSWLDEGVAIGQGLGAHYLASPAPLASDCLLPYGSWAVRQEQGKEVRVNVYYRFRIMSRQVAEIWWSLLGVVRLPQAWAIQYWFRPWSP